MKTDLPEAAPLHLLPTIWFRNIWSWGRNQAKPSLRKTGDEGLLAKLIQQQGEFGTIAR
jgi:hypothetical protein